MIFAFGAARVLLSETSAWPAIAIIGAGFAAPAAITGVAAWAATRRQARMSAGFLESAAIVLAVAAADLALRVLYAGGAVMLEPITSTIGLVSASAAFGGDAPSTSPA